jgi:hypothetical protein
MLLGVGVELSHTLRVFEDLKHCQYLDVREIK